MNSLSNGIVGVWLILLLVAVPGCNTGQKEAVDFNDSIILSLNRLNPAGEAFGRAIGPALAGQPVNMDTVRGAHKAVQETYTGIRNTSKSWKVPEKASAKALYASFEKMMAVEDTVINKDFAEIVKILEDPKATAKAKSDKIQQILQPLDAREKAASAELLSAQQAFAKDYRIKLVQK